MRQEPIRVLQIVGRMDRGGIETMIMNLYRNVDREKVQFDFLAHYGREAVYNDEIRAMGGRIYEMPALKDENHVYYWRYFTYRRALKKFFKEHSEYKVIHGHMTNTASLYLPIAKKNGVTCRIAHSHSTKGKAGLLGVVTDLLQKPVYKFATDFFACSEGAKGWLYPQKLIDAGKVQILANAVDGQRFRFNPDLRQKMRQELALGDCFAVMSVARFRPEKNQIFLIEVLREMVTQGQDVVFVFAGDGPSEARVKEKAAEYGLEKHTRFLGMRTDVAELLQAADAFVLPSLFEGMPVTAIEAQAAGLPCVVSEGLTQEMNVLDAVQYLPLEPKLWAQALIGLNGRFREDTYERIAAAGYDIHTTAPWLQEFYIKKHQEGFM
ncbi:MAG: glycosyltransferase family 1 protein [Ruminococcaceae bacterium]|nr:glycosyltransferase family 1 protein [Oscillospiraceae bacterium]